MKIKLTMLAAVIGATGCLTSIGMAAGIDEFSSPNDRPLILQDFDRIHIETPVASDLAVMNVRIFSPDNELLISKRTMGESVELLVSGLPDGEYRYETVSIFGNVDLSNRENYVPGETTMVRKFGTFKISNGQIDQDMDIEPASPDNASLLDGIINKSMRLAGAALDFLVPSAHAQNLTTSSTSPNIVYDDTTNTSCCEFRTQVIANTDNAGSWTLYDEIGFGSSLTPVIAVNTVATSAIGNSMVIDSDGDIHWANGTLNFDKGLSNLSIGTSTTGAEIVASAFNPEIRLRDESFSDYMGMSYDSSYLNLRSQQGGNIARFSYFAPSQSLVMNSTGSIGIGVGTSPLAKLHVNGDIRTSNYFLAQAATPGFWLDETGSGNKGANIVLDGGVFQFQRRTQGFGAFEASVMRIFINAPAQSFVLNANGWLGLGLGNPTAPIHSVNGAKLSLGGVWQNASSRELKENIEVLDSDAALAAFKSLEPVTFNYKVDSDETYIGFIAEDVPEIVASSDRETLSSMDIIALLTRVVQDQQVTIDDQAQLVTQQNARMDQLEAMIRLVSGLENAEDGVAVNAR